MKNPFVFRWTKTAPSQWASCTPWRQMFFRCSEMFYRDVEAVEARTLFPPCLLKSSIWAKFLRLAISLSDSVDQKMLAWNLAGHRWHRHSKRHTSLCQHLGNPRITEIRGILGKLGSTLLKSRGVLALHTGKLKKWTVQSHMSTMCFLSRKQRRFWISPRKTSPHQVVHWENHRKTIGKPSKIIGNHRKTIGFLANTVPTARCIANAILRISHLSSNRKNRPHQAS
jgi:hypothetical protein